MCSCLANVDVRCSNRTAVPVTSVQRGNESADVLLLARPSPRDEALVYGC